jgi:uncharacterized protein (DUF1330 family)
MSAYVISMMAIYDAKTYSKYTDRTPPIVKRYGGKFPLKSLCRIRGARSSLPSL